MGCYVEEFSHTESELYQDKPRLTCHGKWNRRIAKEYIRKRADIIHGKSSKKREWAPHSFDKKDIVFVRAPGIEERFREYADTWYEEIANEPHSSLTKITSGNENYLKVISLGGNAIPFILRELESNCAPWFLALQILSGDSKVGREQAGNFGRIADAWLEWGRVNGYLTR